MKISKYGLGSASKIENFEVQLGIRLPDDYKAFLMQNNGAAIENASFLVKDIDQEILINVLFGIDTNKRVFDLKFWYNEYKEDIPSNSLLIGNDIGGGFILLICNQENDGIYYYDHSYFFEQSDDDSNTYFICDSFSDFLGILENS